MHLSGRFDSLLQLSDKGRQHHYRYKLDPRPVPIGIMMAQMRNDNPLADEHGHIMPAKPYPHD